MLSLYCTGLGHRGNLTGPSAAEWSRGKPGPLPPIVSSRAVSSLRAPAPKNSSLSGDCSDTFAAALTWAGAGERWGRWRGRAGGPPWDCSEYSLLITAPVVGKWAPGARLHAEGLPVPLPAAARWSPLPHLSQPFCQLCTRPPPWGPQMGGSLCPGHTGDTEPSRVTIQTLQGGCSPAPLNQHPRAPCVPPVLLTPVRPGQAGVCPRGEQGCQRVGRTPATFRRG